MSVAQELLAANFAWNQGPLNPKPASLAATAAGSTIAPTTALSIITSDNGSSKTITTITPPLPGFHVLAFIGTASSPTPFATGGNIGVAYTTIQNRPILFFYNPINATYYPMAVS